MQLINKILQKTMGRIKRIKQVGKMLTFGESGYM
jgi:hypothetical protein